MKATYRTIVKALPPQEACPTLHLNRYYRLAPEVKAAPTGHVAVRCLQCDQGWFLDANYVEEMGKLKF